jgi:single-strand DNA-binding protein
LSSLNKVMLIGRLTRDPEMRYTPSGQPVTSFSIATNRWLPPSQEGGQRQEFTDYHNIVAWNIGKRTLAELVAQYCRKGSLVYVEGRLQTRSWEGQDGQKRRTTEVVANDVQFLDTRGSGGAEEQPAAGVGEQPAAGVGASYERPAGAPQSAGPDIDPDDIPF